MHSRPLTVVALLVATAAAGCRFAAPPQPASLQALWDPADVELVTWQADRRSFQQQFALEASGLTASDRFLYVASEKYARVLQLPIDAPTTARVIAIAVPAHSELEGVAYGGGSALLLRRGPRRGVRGAPAGRRGAARGDGTPPMPAIELKVAGHDIQPGKVGVEGIVVDSAAHRLWLLLERQGTPETGCVSTIYPLRRAGGALEEDRATRVTIGLPDCDWRLSGLELWRGELLALKTQFPGERYELIAIDPATGASRTVLELTDLLLIGAPRGLQQQRRGPCGDLGRDPVAGLRQRVDAGGRRSGAAASPREDAADADPSSKRSSRCAVDTG